MPTSIIAGRVYEESFDGVVRRGECVATHSMDNGYTAGLVYWSDKEREVIVEGTRQADKLRLVPEADASSLVDDLAQALREANKRIDDLELKLSDLKVKISEQPKPQPRPQAKTTRGRRKSASG